jgi:uncharacterized protein YbaP (TraB family)
MKNVRKAVAILMAVLIFAMPVLASTELVPIRAAAEEMGWEVEWIAENQAVRLTTPDGNSMFQFTADEGTNVNGRIYVTEEFAHSILVQGRMPGVEADNGYTPDVNIHGKLTRVVYGDNVAYLFGSMHAGFEYWFPLADIAEDAMARSDVFVFEINMDEMDEIANNPELVAQIEALQMLPDGMTLEDIMDEEAFAQFYEAFATFAGIGLTYNLIANLTPIALVTTLEVVMLQLLGVDVTFSVDSYVADFARDAGAPIVGLNSIQREFEIVFDMPLEIQVNALVDFPTLTEMLEATADVDLASLYAAQDLDGIRELINFQIALGADNEYHEMFYHNLLHVRCHIFADEIARLLQETEEPTTFFVTVGILHIIGGGGGMVIELLDEKGFEVTPLWN